MESKEKGRVIVIVLCCIECAFSAINLLVSLRSPISNPVRDVIRIGLTMGLFICVYKGINWARILTATLMGTAALIVIFRITQYVGMLSQYPAVIRIIIWQVIYLVFYATGSIILFVNKSARLLTKQEQR